MLSASLFLPPLFKPQVLYLLVVILALPNCQEQEEQTGRIWECCRTDAKHVILMSELELGEL